MESAVLGGFVTNYLVEVSLSPTTMEWEGRARESMEAEGEDVGRKPRSEGACQKHTAVGGSLPRSSLLYCRCGARMNPSLGRYGTPTARSEPLDRCFMGG